MMGQRKFSSMRLVFTDVSQGPGRSPCPQETDLPVFLERANESEKEVGSDSNLPSLGKSQTGDAVDQGCQGFFLFLGGLGLGGGGASLL